MSSQNTGAGMLLANHLYAKASLFELVQMSDGALANTTMKLAVDLALRARLHELEASTGCPTGWEHV